METRASYTLVGAFVLVLMLGMAGFVIWLAKFDSNVRYTDYQILFDGSVTGLALDGPVSYLGIPVGTVRSIEIDPFDVDRVRVVVQVDSKTPVKTDSIASIEMQGITGGAYIQIKGGGDDSPDLKPGPGEEMATIKSEKSALQQLFASAPQVLKSANELLERANKLLDENNREAINATLENVRAFTDELAANRASIGEIIQDGKATFENIKQTTDEIKTLSADFKVSLQEITTNVNATLGQLETTLATVNKAVETSDPKLVSMLESFTQTANTANAILAENRVAIRDFTDTGLYEFGQFIVDARGLVASLTQIAQQLERDPASFLLGGNQSGYQTQ
jgi:phospholipid/cholesterol/gamma-HCH transport system substrate-binding protein